MFSQDTIKWYTVTLAHTVITHVSQRYVRVLPTDSLIRLFQPLISYYSSHNHYLEPFILFVYNAFLQTAHAANTEFPK